MEKVENGLYVSVDYTGTLQNGEVFDSSRNSQPLERRRRTTMTNELMSLAWVITLSAVMCIPYILNTIMVRGLTDAVGYPDNPKPLAPWAERMRKAHYNAVENLVMFAALVLMLNALGISNATTVLACNVYFWARLAHYNWLWQTLEEELNGDDLLS